MMTGVAASKTQKRRWTAALWRRTQGKQAKMQKKWKSDPPDGSLFCRIKNENDDARQTPKERGSGNREEREVTKAENCRVRRQSTRRRPIVPS